VKAEKLDLSKKPDPVPRIIQPRSPAYNIAVGVYIAPLEKRLYKDIARVFGSRTVMKGLNAEQVAADLRRKWESIPNPVAVGLDLRRMDQHVSPAALKWEHRVYDCYYHSNELRRLLTRQLVTRGVARCRNGIMQYYIHGRRCSGDMNTGLGNCLLMCGAVKSCMEDLGITRFELANNGDDCVLILSKEDVIRLAGLPGFFSSIGFPVEVEEPVEVFEHIVFCQAQPVFDGERWIMVRDPRLCLDKDAVTIKSFDSERGWNTLRNSVGQCGTALAGDIPVFCEFYRALQRGAGTRVDKDTVETGFKILARGLDRRHREVTDQCRGSFFRAFNISPDEQLALEEHYRSIVPVWKMPGVGGMVGVDGLLAPTIGCVR
jgi:hypothetical protein